MERRAEYTQHSDDRLMDMLASGDVRALEVIAERHVRPVYSLAVRILGDPGWAEEVWQDVLLRLWRRPELYDPARGELRSWLLTVTHHAAVDGLRSRLGKSRTRDAGPDPLENLAQWGVDPAETVARRLDAEVVRAAVARLPTAQREVMELIYYDGLKQTEVAALTGQPLGTVKTRVRLGLNKLRDYLEGTGTRE